jgi:hypothetical protein
MRGTELQGGVQQSGQLPWLPKVKRVTIRVPVLRFLRSFFPVPVIASSIDNSADGDIDINNE